MPDFPEEPLLASVSDGFGYYPASPGMRLHNGQYEVVHKLGFGPRSSVWLVKDITNTLYLALKILTVHASLAQKELEVLTFIKGHRLDELPSLRCSFTVQSAHGEHVCIGLTVMGDSVENLRLSSPSGRLPVHIVKKVIGSMLVPLSILHRKSVVHGAVVADNMLFFIRPDYEDIQAALAELPPCAVEREVVIDEVVYPIVRSRPFPNSFRWNSENEFFVNSWIGPHNMGHAHVGSWKTTPVWYDPYDGLRPPEVIIETSYDSKVDVWMLGCVAFRLLTGEALVPREKTKDEGDELAWIQAMVEDIIKPEMALRSADGVRQCFFNEEGMQDCTYLRRHFDEDIPEESISTRMETMEGMTPDEKQEAVQFIKQCLALDPADRPTMYELESHPWLQPGYSCSCGLCGC